jgi:UDP-N-acetyl-D-mannosaminuronic acid transferase (WecB/TagA/CpsF family)
VSSIKVKPFGFCKKSPPRRKCLGSIFFKNLAVLALSASLLPTQSAHTLLLGCLFNKKRIFMYSVNVSVIKSILSRMPKEEFMRHARYIHAQSLSLPVGVRKRMFERLFLWCQNHFQSKWV